MDPAKLLEAALGVALVVFIVWKLFPGKTPLTLSRVRENFQRCYPDVTIDDIIMADTTAAFILLSGKDMIGVARTLGDRVVCRLIARDQLAIKSVGNGLWRMTIGDFTMPSMTLRLDDSDVARLKALSYRQDEEEMLHAG